MRQGPAYQVVLLSFVAACSVKGASCQCQLGGKDGIDRKKIETAVREMAEASTLPVKSVRCPDKMPATDGSLFDCDVDLGVGTYPAEVAMKADYNANVHWKRPMMGGKALEGEMVRIAKQSEPTLETIDCGTQLLIMDEPRPISCKVVAGPPGRVEATASGETLHTAFIREP
jgi:hypothetical protein